MQLSPLVFDRYVAPARLRPQIWRLVLGVGVLLAVYLGWIAGMFALVGVIARSTMIEGDMGPVGTGSTPAGLILLLLTFVGMALGTFAAVRLVHKRSIASLFGPRKIVIRDFGVASGIFALVALPGLIWSFTALELSPGVGLSVWLLFLPLAVAGLLIQTGAEELVFRGYLQQQLAARFASRWMWMVLPSVVFGLVHYSPEQLGPSLWPVMATTGFFGLLMADLTARSGSLGMAWGLHFTNNFLAMMIFTTGEALDGLALYRMPFSITDTDRILPLLGVDVMGMIVVWAIGCWYLRGR
jgi:membrane protease YdiL (CAAX protease family)